MPTLAERRAEIIEHRNAILKKCKSYQQLRAEQLAEIESQIKAAEADRLTDAKKLAILKILRNVARESPGAAPEKKPEEFTIVFGGVSVREFDPSAPLELVVSA